MVKRTLFVGVLCGIVGVLVDLDHVYAYFAGLPAIHAKIAHLPLFVIAWIVFVGVVTYCAGLYIRVVLKGGNHARSGGSSNND